ncbi:MAG: hypothetical protein V1708_03955 [Candidatus Micrarchaeota archaeon]
MNVKRFQHEPRNLEHFTRRHGLNLPGDYVEKTQEVVEQIADLVNPTSANRTGGQRKVQLIFPLAGSLALGEFTRGVLHVLSRQTPVSFLKTPKVSQINQGYIPIRRMSPIELNRVRNNIRRMLKPGTNQVMVIDGIDQGVTLRAITQAIKQNQPQTRMFPRIVNGAVTARTKTDRIMKSIQGFLLDIYPSGLPEHNPEPRTGVEANFSTSRFVNSLGSAKSYHGQYFGTQYGSAFWGRFNAIRREGKKSGLTRKQIRTRILEYKSQIPPEEKREWIREEKRLAAWRQNCFHLGIAAAKTYLEKVENGVKTAPPG